MRTAASASASANVVGATRILSLWKESNSAFNEEEFKKNHHVFSRSSCFTETVFDKNLTHGKVESSVKNDFNFEKRDWMSVNAEELPHGSQLIIGLNPPFGVKGYLANKFIDKALTFKTKLLILIVPKVTKRLDKKNGGYDLIWEDDELLSGKSFYLPGSVDIRDKQLECWNQKPPPLYLWSRPDWTPWHREIAQKHGHIKKKYDVHVKGKDVKNYLMEENHDYYQDYPGLHAPNDFLSIFDGVPDDNGDIAPEEGATSNTLGHLKKTMFSACGREMEWEDGLPSDEAEEMFIDMDLSSP